MLWKDGTEQYSLLNRDKLANIYLLVTIAHKLNLFAYSTLSS